MIRAGGRAGFTLTEVIVALLVLEIGLLAVAGLVSLSNRTLNRAVGMERAVAAMQAVTDSLARLGTVDEGERSTFGPTIRWRPAGGRHGLRWIVLQALAADPSSADSAEVLLEARFGLLPVGPGEEPSG